MREFSGRYVQFSINSLRTLINRTTIIVSHLFMITKNPCTRANGWIVKSAGTNQLVDMIHVRIENLFMQNYTFIYETHI